MKSRIFYYIIKKFYSPVFTKDLNVEMPIGITGKDITSPTAIIKTSKATPNPPTSDPHFQPPTNIFNPSTKPPKIIPPMYYILKQIFTPSSKRGSGYSTKLE